jgi:hypothetical protein
VDWIERLLHVSPDGGNGMTEVLYLVAAVVIVVVIVMARLARRAHHSSPAGMAVRAMTRREEKSGPRDSAGHAVDRRRQFEQERGRSDPPRELDLDDTASGPAEDESSDGRHG